MKKRRVMHGKIACVAFMLLYGAGALPAQARSMADILKTRELRICISPYDPATATAEPPNCRDNCQFSGPVYEESEAFAHSIKGVRPKFIKVDWDEQFFNKDGKTARDESYTPELLASGKCDFFPSNLTKNDWRQKKMDFVTLFPSRMMVIVKKSRRSEFKNVADLRNKTAAMVKDTSFHTWLQEQNAGALAAHPARFEFMTTSDTVEAVEDGKADFTIADADQAMWATRKLKNATAAFPVGQVDEIGWAFRKEDKDLQKTAQQFFDTQRKNRDSELNKIWKKYFGRSLTEFIALMASVQ